MWGGVVSQVGVREAAFDGLMGGMVVLRCGMSLGYDVLCCIEMG